MTEKIRIVYLIGQLGLGGSERQLYLLLKHLDKKIFEPHVVVINPSPHVVLNDRLEAEGVRVYAIPENCRGILRRARYLYRLFRNISPHIIHSWTVHDNPYAGLIGWLARVPARWGAVRGSIHSRGFRSLPAFFQWLSMHSVAKLAVNSTAIVDELQAEGYSPENIILIQNCVDCSPPQTIPDLLDWGIEKHHRLVGIVGNLRRLKNHEMFIAGMSRILPDESDVRGIIIGQPIPDEAELPEKLAAQIKELGLNGQIILAGFRADVPDLMHRLSVFCLTSTSEGTPNAILEAMAAARPVVATRVGGIPELVQDGVNGFLVAPGDVDGFAGAVKRLLDDPDLAEHMGRAGREFVARNFSCETAARRLENLYCNALASRKA